MKSIAMITIFCSFFGASFLSLDLGAFQLTPFRVALIMLGTLLFINKIYYDTYKFKVKNRSVFNDKRLLFLLLWLSYDIITIIWVKDYVRWAKSVVFIGIGFMCAIIFMKILTNENDFIRVFRTIEVAAIIYNIFGWYEVITRNYLFYRPEKAYIFDLWKVLGKRVPVFIASNENEYALVLILMFFSSYILSKYKKNNLLSNIIMISEIILIFLTGSRGAIISLLLGISTLIWIKFNELYKEKKLVILRIVLVVSLLLLVFIFIYLWSTDIIRLSFSDNKSDSFRISLLLTGLNFLLDTYFLGVGGGNIEYWMYNYAPEVSNYTYANIHSWWAEILVSYGIGIFILYIIYYFSIYLELYKRNKDERNKTKKNINTGIIAYMTSFIISSMVSSSLLKVEWLWLFWGVVVAYLFNYVDIGLEK